MVAVIYQIARQHSTYDDEAHSQSLMVLSKQVVLTLMRNAKTLLILLLVIMLALTACDDGGDEVVAVAATATLIPPPGSLPDPSATPFASRTPLPTITPTPSDTPIPSETPLPSETPTPVPIIGIIQSLNTVNVRSGPGTRYNIVQVLTPGTGVEVIQSNPEGDWYLIEFETNDDGDVEVGWIYAPLLFIQDPPTPVPTFTHTPDATALALGTGTPIGGGTVTATLPPGALITPTPAVSEVPPTGSPQPTSTDVPTLIIPTLDLNSIDQTATALAGGGLVRATPVPAMTEISIATEPVNEISVATESSSTGGTTRTSTPAPTADEGAEAASTEATPSGPGEVQEGADIFAMCDNPAFGISPPRNLAAGSTAEVYWAWLVKERQFMDQHLQNVTYEVRINGRLLSGWRQYGEPIIDLGNAFAKYWYVPVGELEEGDYQVTYRATWSQQISDGWTLYGPGTRNPAEEGSCTFTVR